MGEGQAIEVEHVDRDDRVGSLHGIGGLLRNQAHERARRERARHRAAVHLHATVPTSPPACAHRRSPHPSCTSRSVGPRSVPDSPSGAFPHTHALRCAVRPPPIDPFVGHLGIRPIVLTVANRLCDALGIEIPIIQAPMGYIARAQLAAAVSNAGGMGIIETGSGEFDDIRDEFARMADLTDKPWGANVPQLLVRDPAVVDFVASAGVRFVTTSAGNPEVLVPLFKRAGITVFHVVPTLRGALKAVAAGADGLIVEGVEGGGFKNPDGASTMVLVPLVAQHVGVPIVAAGGICDGVSMAAALALGADGAQMGTRMLTAAESPVHDNWKRAVVDAAETDTVVLNRFTRPAMRALRTEYTAPLEREEGGGMAGRDRILDLYFGGDMNAAVPMSGQVAGRIDEVLPVADILRDTWDGCRARLAELAARMAD
ncbi:MAG: nitronate monooxygenase [Acidimicrobiales bacterium]|nr:nitronate monooxygenase [Acidimicrobiales bacterium]